MCNKHTDEDRKRRSTGAVRYANRTGKLDAGKEEAKLRHQNSSIEVYSQVSYAHVAPGEERLLNFDDLVKSDICVESGLGIRKDSDRTVGASASATHSQRFQ